MGAWIEMGLNKTALWQKYVAPHVGAWIEIRCPAPTLAWRGSHPTWVRGLKLGGDEGIRTQGGGRTPRGCVD